jgi:hypothetical protein
MGESTKNTGRDTMQSIKEHFAWIEGASGLHEAVEQFKTGFASEDDLFESVLDQLDGLSWRTPRGEVIATRFRDMDVDWSTGPYSDKKPSRRSPLP